MTSEIKRAERSRRIMWGIVLSFGAAAWAVIIMALTGWRP